MLLTSSLRRWINYAPCSLRNLNIVLVSSQVDAVSFEPFLFSENADADVLGVFA